MKFLHAADLHLDSPMRGLRAYAGAPEGELRGATRQALRNLVTLAIDEAVAFVVIAGDVYDGAWRDANTGLFFVAEMQRLTGAGIPVVLLTGNHDADSVVARALPLPDGVTVLPTDRPATVELAGARAAVHGQGFATRAVTENLAAAYPPPVPGVLNVGLLHTSADGRPGHERYAPCTVAELVGRGYGYWALGHVHAREVLHEDPWVVFSGNPQGRHAKETGAKGATLVTYADGRVTAVEHRTLDVVRWARVVVDLDAVGAGTRDAAFDAVRDALGAAVEDAGGRLVAARVVFEGVTDAHAELAADPAALADEIRALAVHHGGRLWVEEVRVRTRPRVDVAAMRERDDALGDLLRGLHDVDGSRLGELARDLEPLRARLPTALREGEDAFDPTAPETVRELLGDVERLLLARLHETASTGGGS